MNINPPLEWKGAPPETISSALIIYFPDNKQGVFTIWLINDIQKKLNLIDEGTVPGIKLNNSYQNKFYCAHRF